MIDILRRYRYVVQDKDRRGNVRTYLRLPGKAKVRLREVLGTDAFDAEYRAALVAKPKASAPVVGAVLPGSLDALCVAYYRSADFKRMDIRSQRVRRLILDKFRGTHGTKPAARLEVRHLLQIRDDKADTPEAANSLLKALRAVFKRGVVMGLVQDNPALKVAYLAGNPDGFHAWSLEEVERFESRHPVGSKARLAFALLLYTGQRRGDVVLLGQAACAQRVAIVHAAEEPRPQAGAPVAAYRAGIAAHPGRHPDRRPRVSGQ